MIQTRMFLKLLKISIVILACWAPTASFGQQPITAEIKEAFHLVDGSIVLIEGDFQNAQATITDIVIDGKEYELELHPHSIRTEEFILKVQEANGVIRTVQPAPSRTVRGAIRGSKGSRVTGAVANAGVAARIEMGDGAIFYMEPLRSKFPDTPDSRSHVLYSNRDTKPHAGKCGNLDKELQPFEKVKWQQQQVERRRHQALASDSSGNQLNGSIGTQIAELGLDADVEFFNNHQTVQGTLDRMELVINIVNEQYERDVAISHVISGAVVRTAEPDPYDTQGNPGILNQFRTEWLDNQSDIQRDVAQLFTGQEIGGPIGIAFTGTICGSFGFGVVQSDFNGSLNCSTDLSAHELGHNWDSGHCDCPGFTMNPFLTCGNQFTTQSINSIVAHRDSRNCLETKGPLNDDFINSIAIEAPTILSATNSGTTTQEGEPDTANVGATVWWNFIAPNNGMARIDLEGSTFDTVLHVYTDSENGLGNMTPVAFNDDETNTIQSDVNFPVVGGQRYEIRVGGFGNGTSAAQGDIELDLSFKLHGPVDIFLSGQDFGAFNTSAGVGEFNAGTTGSIFVLYSPMVSELDTGMFLDIASSQPGVIEFTQAESFDFDIVTAGGVPFAVRWGDGFGDAEIVSSNSIESLGAVNIVGGTGMLLENTGPVFFDTGYDFSSAAFLFGQIDFEVTGQPGDAVNIQMTRGASMVVHNEVALDPDLGSFRLVVTEALLLGDINCDGVVNLLDVGPFVDLIANGLFSAKADFDGDGSVNLLDVGPFVDALSGG